MEIKIIISDNKAIINNQEAPSRITLMDRIRIHEMNKAFYDCNYNKIKVDLKKEYNYHLIRKSADALNKFDDIMHNDLRFGGKISKEEWSDVKLPKYGFETNDSHLYFKTYYVTYHPIVFHTEYQRSLFIEEYRKLLEDYFIIKL